MGLVLLGNLLTEMLTHRDQKAEEKREQQQQKNQDLLYASISNTSLSI